MKSISSQPPIFLFEVLGVKNYLCPKNIYSFRSLKGGLPCQTLAVVFKTPLSHQEALLKKIMASIDIFQFSLLEIKNPAILKELFFSANSLAERICFFGGEDMEKESLLIKKGDLFMSSAQKRSRKPAFFLQTQPLEELEGSSPQVIDRKKQLWQKLKTWKALSQDSELA